MTINSTPNYNIQYPLLYHPTPEWPIVQGNAVILIDALIKAREDEFDGHESNPDAHHSELHSIGSHIEAISAPLVMGDLFFWSDPPGEWVVGQLDHNLLDNILPDQHHNRQHGLNSASDHTGSLPEAKVTFDALTGHNHDGVGSTAVRGVHIDSDAEPFGRYLIADGAGNAVWQAGGGFAFQNHYVLVTAGIVSSKQVTIPAIPLSNSESVTLNGAVQYKGSSLDYTITGAVITFQARVTLTVGDEVYVKYTA